MIRPFPLFTNRRQKALLFTISSAALLTGIVIASLLMGQDKVASHLDLKNAPPSLAYWFGTDWLGRDMFARTIKGLSVSLRIGVIASTASVLIALVLGLASALGGRLIDSVVTWLIDLFLGLPHLVTIILIAFAMGGGVQSVIIGVALTHWTGLARIVRAEVMQLRSAPYVRISRRLGRSRWWVATRHMLPHLIPQLLVGMVLLFPHAILHEAAITFIGLGLSTQQPAIGNILSESMQYLAGGMWWLAFFPGLALLVVVRAFDVLGGHLRSLVDPRSIHD